jgi:hypothetical protein
MWLKLWLVVLWMWLKPVNRENFGHPLNRLGSEKNGPGEGGVGAKLLAKPDQHQSPQNRIEVDFHDVPLF